MEMTLRGRITEEFLGKTTVDFWNDLKVGDVLEFRRGHRKWSNMTILNIRTHEYVPDNKWTPYLRDATYQAAPDDSRAVFEPIKAYQ